MLLKAGFRLVRKRGSHRIYIKSTSRMVLPFHPGKVLHPKIVKQLQEAIDRAE
jgi:predicted RNA binding protein YcfA (HicA-like mRNA interferase family)